MSHNSNRVIDKEHWEKIYPPKKLTNNPYHETFVQIKERVKKNPSREQLILDIETLLVILSRTLDK